MFWGSWDHGECDSRCVCVKVKNCFARVVREEVWGCGFAAGDNWGPAWLTELSALDFIVDYSPPPLIVRRRVFGPHNPKTISGDLIITRPG